MKRLLLTLAAFAAFAAANAAPASAYTPNPDGPYKVKKGPCLKCGISFNRGSIVTNPGNDRINKVALNPQPLPPKAIVKLVR